ncbi:putative UPF0481 protein [Nymphaea thermarum]|nr:putative UPF0481 protein [Nymphaea thermarum]
METRPHWVIDMETEYASYNPFEYESELKRKCIYRWPNDLVITSSLSKHCTPHMASFGPYHHENENLQPMEQHIQRAVYRILNRSRTRTRVSLYSFIESLKGIEQELRDSYDNLEPKKSLITEQQRTPSEEGFIKSVCMRCQRWLHVIGKGIKQMPFAIPILFYRLLVKQNSKPGNVRSAVRFNEAGVEFKTAERFSGLQMNFDKESGVLTLPSISIDDYTAAIYMNLMAFERMHPEIEKHEVTSYVSFMDDLIDTAEDVSLLCSRQIVKNDLGSDEDAANVFNKLGDGITYTRNKKLYEDLQLYVASDWNAARAYLKRNYFQNPWSILSLLAATALLDVTDN